MLIWYFWLKIACFLSLMLHPHFWQFFNEKFKAEKELKNYGKLSETLIYKAFIRLS